MATATATRMKQARSPTARAASGIATAATIEARET